MKTYGVLACAALGGLALIAACSEPTADRYELLIVNGNVYDGSGGEARSMNIGVTGGRIVSTDVDADAAADLRIDATGLAVMPTSTRSGSVIIDLASFSMASGKVAENIIV